MCAAAKASTWLNEASFASRSKSIEGSCAVGLPLAIGGLLGNAAHPQNYTQRYKRFCTIQQQKYHQQGLGKERPGAFRHGLAITKIVYAVCQA